MTNEELKKLFHDSLERIDELEAKYRSGEQLTKRDCRALRECNKRLRAVAVELWVRQGKPEGEDFDILRNPPVWQPYPWQKALVLPGDHREVH